MPVAYLFRQGLHAYRAFVVLGRQHPLASDRLALVVDGGAGDGLEGFEVANGEIGQVDQVRLAVLAVLRWDAPLLRVKVNISLGGGGQFAHPAAGRQHDPDGGGRREEHPGASDETGKGADLGF